MYHKRAFSIMKKACFTRRPSRSCIMYHKRAFSIMILSNPGGVGWLKFSNTASRIAPSSTERDDRYKLLQKEETIPKKTGKTVPLMPRTGVSRFLPLQKTLSSTWS